MAEHRLGTGERLSADLIAQRGFTTNRRGFDPDEVKGFLKSVADTVRDLREQLRVAEAARQDAEYRALHPKIDEEMLVAGVGEEMTNILRTARAAALEMRTKAENQATTLLRDAQARKDAIDADADALLTRMGAEAEHQAAALMARAEEDADRTRALARHEAETIRQQADQERKMTVEAAQQIREQILSDLSRRRRVANTQIEQLRAGRERLLEAYLVVRRTLDEVTDELQRADGEARQAADEVAKRAAARPSDDLLIDLMPGSSPALRASLGVVDPEPSVPIDEPTAQFDALADDEEPVAPENQDTPEDPPVADPTPQATAPAQPVVRDAWPEPSRGSTKAPPASSRSARRRRGQATVPPPLPPEAPSKPSFPSPPAVSPPEGSRSSSPPVSSSRPVSSDLPSLDLPSLDLPSLDPPSSFTLPGVAPAGVSSQDVGPSFEPGGPFEDQLGHVPTVPVITASGESRVTVAGPNTVMEAPDEVESVRLLGAGTVASPPRVDRSKSTAARRGPGSTHGPSSKLHAAEEPAPGDELGDDKQGEDEPRVDGIFARIRADRADSVVKARSVLDEESEAAVVPEGSDWLPRAFDALPSGAVTPFAADTSRRPIDTSFVAESEVPIPDGDEGILQQRDKATADGEVALARRLKRALQDEQNDLLDRLRQVRRQQICCPSRLTSAAVTPLQHECSWTLRHKPVWRLPPGLVGRAPPQPLRPTSTIWRLVWPPRSPNRSVVDCSRRSPSRRVTSSWC
jgi:DivIVA domain-containing protein